MPFRVLSILMPVYNEKDTIEAIVDEVRAAPLPEGMAREIILVDDGSTDGTRDLLKQMEAAGASDLRIVFQPANRGKGAAVARALREATGDICIIQDADLEYDPKEYGRILRPILNGDADVVYGSRFLASDYCRVLYFWHSLGNRFLTFLSNVFTNLTLTDMETCYKAAKTSIFKSIPIRSRRFGIEPELTAKFAKRRCRIYEVPISYRGRTYQEGKKITWVDGLKTLLTILRFWVVDDCYEERYGHAILHTLEHSRRFNRWMAAQFRPRAGERVLEVGAGIGTLTQLMLPRKTYRATDVDPLYLDFLRNRFEGRRNFSVQKLDLESAADFADVPEPVDTVLCINVLEHVEGDVEALRRIRSILKPGGRLILLVPRGAWLYGSLDRVAGHQRRYAPAELRAKASEAGFRVERFFTFNKPGVIGWILNSLILRRTGFGRLQLKIFDTLVWLWRPLEKILPWPGLSIIAVLARD
jgi:glycosyltransferase involved in cell wall biosynthesis